MIARYRKPGFHLFHGMGKKKINPLEQLMELIAQYDPSVPRLAHERFLNGQQLFNSKTHRLRKDIRDEAQARGILLVAQELASTYKRVLKLSADEKKLLKKMSGETAISEPPRSAEQ